MPFLPVFVAAALAAGAALGVLWPQGLVAAAGLAGLSWVVAMAAWRAGWRRALVVVAHVGVVATATVLGAHAFTDVARPSLVTVLDEAGVLAADAPADAATVMLEGRLAADAAPLGRGVLLRLQAERVWLGPCGCPQPVAGGVVVTVAGDLSGGRVASWRAGRRVKLTVAMRLPRVFRNTGGPDERADLVRRRAALAGSVKSALLVDVVAPGSWASEAAAALRARARAALGRAAGDQGGEAAAIGTAVLVGDRAGLDVALQQRLQRAGTYHVIAISGGNIALFSALVLALARAVSRHRGGALLAAGAVLVAYALVVGGGASVLRATGMALVGIAAQLLDQRGAAVNVLALTAGVLVAADPLLAVDAGFWLTTAATAGIMVGLPPPRAGEPRWRAWTRALLLTSVWAELALLPVVTAVFQQVTVAGVLLSAVAIPGMAVTQMAAVAAVMADLVAPPLLPWTGVLLRSGAAVVTESARLVDAVPWLSWLVPPPGVVSIGLYYIVFGGALWARHERRDTALAARLRQLTALACPLLVLWMVTAPWTLLIGPPRDLRITALDVGQGEALLVQFPNGRRLLVDAGGAGGDGRDLGERVIGPALRARGIRRLDYLLVTHADTDHIGGAATLVRQFAPAEVWTGVPVDGDLALARLHEAADATSAVWRTLTAGARVSVGGVAVSVVHPPAPDWERQRVRNDDSVVLAIALGDVRLVLTGDVGTEVEAAVANAVTAADPAGQAPLTVLKVAHHGSAGSTGQPFVAALAPTIALVSVGAGNRFGHPAPAVLQRLADVGADVWRTDRDGEITVRTDGRSVELSSFTGRHRWLTVQPR